MPTPVTAATGRSSAAITGHLNSITANRIGRYVAFQACKERAQKGRNKSMSGNKLRFLLIVVCAASLAVVGNAQEQPVKGELFGGYQYTRIGSSGGINANGWNTAISGSVNRWFSVTADFSGAYKSIGGVNAKAYTYTFGPTFSARGERVTPFAHVLFGGLHASAGFEGLNASTSGFAMIAGGGVDVKATEHIAIRVIQGDWILWHVQGTTSKSNGRISAGIVFRF